MKDRNLEARFQRAKADALQRVDALLSHYLPGGKRHNREYLVKNPVRGESNPSLSINLDSGAWYDFASADKGGDLISLVGYLEGCKPGRALEELEAFLGLADNGTSPAAPARPVHSQDPSGDGWAPVAPVPEAALATLPQRHPKHGEPSKRSTYTDAEGRLVMVVDRFDLPQGKEFSPLSYWRHATTGEGKWQRKGLPEPRPLLNLEHLAADPAAPVVVCEGEKAADAAAQLMPDHVATCWPNGANAVEKVDFAPLKDRHVVLWPDNDKAGLQCMEGLAGKLQALGAASVRLVDLSTLEGRGEWNNKDDAADLLARGWTAMDLKALASEGALFRDPTPVKGKGRRQRQASAQPTPGFTLKESGLYAIPEDGEPRRVCEPLEIIAQTRDERGRRWGLLVEFKDPDGVTKRHNIPAEALISEGAKDAISPLLDMGLKLDPKRQARNTKNDLISYLQGYAGDARARLVERLGWHGDAYLLPAGAIGDTTERLEFLQPDAELPSIEEAGSLEEWKRHVGAYCPGNDRLTFFVCVGLAAPFLHLLGLESGGFHAYGSSSTGKSTLLFTAASVYGSHKLVGTWRTTDNKLETVAAAHSDGLLVLDEIGQCSPKIVGEIAYMLASGQGKGRATDRGAGRPVRSWRTLFVSSGEMTLAEHMGEAQQQHRAGMDVRMLAIPADAGADMGVFQNLHGFDNPADLADHLKASAARYHGTPLVALLEQLTNPGLQAVVIQSFQRQANAFVKEALPPKASGQARRAATRFALVGFAGEIATGQNATGWPPGTAWAAAKACFAAWLADRGGAGDQEDTKVLEALCHLIEAHGEGRFTRLNIDFHVDPHAPRTPNKLGYRRTETLGSGDNLRTVTTFFIPPGTWRSEVWGRAGLPGQRQANKVLKVRGVLKLDHEGKTSVKVSGLSGSPRFYVFTDADLYAARAAANDDMGQPEERAVNQW